jgi:hypothetical protein
MNFAMFTLSLHVLVAVLGVGTIGALPLAARGARHAALAPSTLAVWLLPLVLTARISLFLAFASGALLDYASHGAFHEALWFRISGLLLVLTAICLARAKAALTHTLSGRLDAPIALRRIEAWGFTSVSTVACIVLLMEWRPF